MPADFNAPPAEEAVAEGRAIVLLRQSGLFDAGFYLAACGPLPSPQTDPLRHYLHGGWQRGLWPNPCFDPAFYLEQNPDVRRSGGEPLLHYLLFGEAEGRRPVAYFDPAWYRATYGLTQGCLAHYLAHRQGGAVSPGPEFDSAWYLRTYADVAAARMDPVEHYMVQGFREARDPSPDFDARFYRQRYLADAPDENPLLHYLRHRHLPGIHPRMPSGEASVAREVRRFTRAGPEFEEVCPLPAALARRARVLAFYLPQFHPCAENDAWWGRGFTEWTSLARGTPRFAGHYQPRIPRDLGHYSLDDPATLRRQIDLARGAGLGGFVFYFYWFNGRRLLDRPLEILLADASLDFPFCLMWANENWTRRWDGAAQEVLIAQEYHAEDEAALLATYARHFADSRYIRLAGRPLLMIYRPRLIPDTAATIARWRQRFRDLHAVDPVLLMAQSFDDEDPRPFGLDGAVEFPPHKLTRDLPQLNPTLRMLDHEFTGQVYGYDAVVARALAAPPSPYPLLRTAMPGWDNDARRQGAGMVVHGATPAAYQAWLDTLLRQARPLLGERLVCVNAWNEWAEGAYLEPDVQYGAAFLNATARAIGGLAPRTGAAGLLLIGHDAFPAGAQHLLLHLGRQLRAAHGVAVEFLLLGDGALRGAYEATASCTLVTDSTALPATLLRLRHARGIRAAIVNTVAAGWAVPLLAAEGIESLLLVHEMPRLIAEKNLAERARQGAEAARRVVFPAAFVQQRFAEIAPVAAERAMIMPQGRYRDVRFSPAQRRRLRHTLGVPEGGLLAIGVGYGDLRKGFDLFLQLWRATRRRRQPVHLLWLGDLDPQLRLHLGAEIAAAEAAGGGVHAPGWRDDVAAWLSAADALLLTSREDPYPSSVLEAAGAGLPAIAFAGSGGAPALLEATGGGDVVPLGDTAAMARALLARGVTPPAERQRRARAAARRDRFAAYGERLLDQALPGLLAVSVVVPNYNYARYLPARLGSIFAQTYPVREVILLDDASTDDSVAIARQTAAAWGRTLRILRRARNSGTVAGQWQRAATVARGDFVWIAEADDDCAPALLEMLAGAIAAVPEATFGFCDSRAIDGDGRLMSESYRAEYSASAGVGALGADAVFPAEDFARRCLAERNLIFNASAVLWRRSALRAALDGARADLARLRLACDWRLYLEALTMSGAGPVVYVAAALNQHRRHGESTSRRLDTARHLEEIRALHRLAAQRLPGDALLRQRQDAYLSTVREQFRREAGQ